MLMTTTLLTYFLIQKGTPKIAIAIISIGLFCIEGSFFAASLVQFINGAYIVVLIALAIIFVMFIWNKSHKIVMKYIKSLNINE